MIGAIAISEPGAGSDVASIKTTAKSDGDDYVINGSKMWITNALSADFFCTLVNTSEGKTHSNKSLLIIPAKTLGVRIGKKLDKLGMRSSETAPVFFDNVRVPSISVLAMRALASCCKCCSFRRSASPVPPLT